MTRTIAQVISSATARLRAAGIDDPSRDARRLVAFASGVDPGRLTLHLPDPFEAEEVMEAALSAREARQPVSQIVGERQFFGRSFKVSPDVLDPRPETEVLISTALEAQFSRVLDLGTGSGCILLTLLAENLSASGVGADLSEAALNIARKNQRELELDTEFIYSNWYDRVAGKFDLIVSNPPYIAASEMHGLEPELRLWEPRMALTDEGDGLGAYRAIAAGARQHLTPGGRLIVEIGPTQGTAVVSFFLSAGLEDARIILDMDGRDRVVVANAPETDL